MGRATFQFCVRTGAWLALGASVAQVIAPHIPAETARVTGTAAPSIALAALFFIASQMVSTAYTQLSNVLVVMRFNKKSNAAWRAFMDARRGAYDQHLFDLCELWKAYTGKEYKILSSMSVVFASDQALFSRYLMEHAAASEGQFGLLKNGVVKFKNSTADIFRRMLKRKKEAVIATTIS
ncbi:MAG: hypothetical protein KGI78_03555 [Patescibacteria group bacterium]|nr:hypothetical protein [Patescibacteria group bacterium]MDE2057903.1 hypothetical protein [Patescibacteria group bacterium]